MNANTPPLDATAFPTVLVETWLLHVVGGRWLSSPCSTNELRSGRHPHELAAAVAADADLRADVVHSTSWRMHDGDIVLTYVVVTPDRPTGPTFDVHTGHDHRTGTTECHSGMCDAVGPPSVVTHWDVLHHALHHLALLARTDPAIIDALGPTATASLLPLAPAPAGVLATIPA